MTTKNTLTRQDTVAEIVKCGKDPIYFLKTYVKIQHPTRSTIPFKTYEFQDDCIKAFMKFRQNIILKSRQLGLSTITAGYAVWLAIFHKDKNILIIATKKDVAINVIKKIKVMLSSLPAWLLLPQIITESLTTIRFSNGSEIKAIPTSPSAGRSEALSLLIIDEAAFIKDFKEIWTGLSPTITTGGAAIILSTPNGVGNMYHSLWTEAEAGLNELNPIKLPWYVHPERDELWYAKEIRNLKPQEIAQEYECDFISSGDTFLKKGELEFLRNNIETPSEKNVKYNGLWVWKKPEPGANYVIGADVARGDGGDYSTFHVIDYDTYEVVAEYMQKTAPDTFADILFDIGKQYNNALICPESNTFGYFTCKRLVEEHNYPKMYHNKLTGNPFANYSVIKDVKYGFDTQTKSRSQILTKLEELIRNKKLTCYSQRVYDQLLTFIWEGAKAQALRGTHDDLVMSLAIACWIASGGKSVAAKDTQKTVALINATHVTRRSIDDVLGSISKQRHEQNIRNRIYEHHMKDTSWLY